MVKKITPWNKEVEKLFDSIAKYGKAYTEDITITRSLGKKLPDLFDEQEGLMDIGRIGKTRKSMIVPRIGVQLVPLPDRSSYQNRLKRKKTYQIYRV